MEFLEDGAALGLRNADAGVVHLDAQLVAAAAAADQHVTLGRVFDRVRDQVLQQPPQQAAIGADSATGRHEDEIQAFGAGDRREFDFEPVQQIIDAEIGEFGLHGAGVEPRNIE